MCSIGASMAELAYLRSERLLARIATVGSNGTAHIAPVGMWSRNAESDAIDVTGRDFDQTKKFRENRPDMTSRDRY